jgi:hypothetical protein
VLILLRGAIVFEISRYALGRYPGVWRVSRAILGFVAGLVVVTGLMTSEPRGPYRFRAVVGVERGRELAILGVLLFALAFCRYYRIPVARVSGMLAVGIGVFAATQVANDWFVNHWLERYMRCSPEVRVDAFLLPLFIWLAALWKPLPTRLAQPLLLEPTTYSSVWPTVSVRLRELNTRLEKMMK